MIFKVSEDNRFLILMDSTEIEYQQLMQSFTKKVDNWFIIKKKMPNSSWNGETIFFDQKFGRIPIGLWNELKKLCAKYYFPLQILESEKLYDNTFNEDEFKEWLDEYFDEAENLYPYPHQIEGAIRAIKYMNCTEEISTSGGKTLISFLIFKYLYEKQKIKKLLYIVPNIGLITQSEEKYYEYEDKCNKKPNWVSECIYSDAKKKDKPENANITFGTYQSLTKKNVDFFKDYDAVLVDECLHPDTLITMFDFSKKKIKDVKIGDKVWTKNENTNKLEIKEVDYVYKNLSKGKQTYEITLANGIKLIITGNHKLLNINNTWKRTDKLDISDKLQLLNYNGTREIGILSIKEIDYKEDVYNLRIKHQGETNHNYFANDICVSNCHHSDTTSIKNIMVKCFNAKYKIGLTGTYPKDDSCSNFVLQAYLGPKVYIIHSHELIDNKQATPINVIQLELNYLEDDLRKKLFDLRNVKDKDGAKLLTLEKDLVRENKKRLKYICQTIAKNNKNTLVLFSDIKNEYGRNIYNWLRENTDKNVFYIDGGTDNKNRDYCKQQMEEQDDVIIVASSGVFSEGIDIKNLHNIHVTETHKSDKIVRQILGRGMRLMNTKEKVNVFDYYDNFEYGSGYQRKNYLVRHANERERIYVSKRFPYKKFKINL